MKKLEYPGIGETLYGTRLANGLEVRVIPKKEFSTFYAAFAANYGGACRRFAVDGKTVDTPAGVAHYLEHKMFDLPNGDSALNILSANGADPNAFTSSGMTCYYFQCTEGFEENLRMLLHFVSTPYFTAETVRKELGIIGQEIRMGEDNPGLAVYYNLLKLLYEHHPIRDRVAGTVESIAEITAETLYDCHRVFYAPSNMALCVEGDVDPDGIARIAEEVLPKDCAPVPAADFGAPESLLPAGTFRCEEMPVSAPQFLIGLKLPGDLRGEESLRLQLTAALALRMLCGASSPFFTRLYAEGLLTADFDFEVDPSAGTLTVIVGGESREPEKVLGEFQKACADIAAKGFEPAFFERAKRASLGARLRGLEDFDNVCVSLAEGVFDGYCALDACPLLEEVSAEDCRRFVEEHLRPERMALSVIAPKKAQV
ncbi:MAG: insulinase family protein [Oscillospiraceae bacterium]|nr:insulinase family protein [Oscillospiraceae bacterium]